jgi:uncharacterized protein (TIGR03067 family)
MYLTKLKTVVVVLLVVAALGGAAGLNFQTKGAEPAKSEGASGSPASEVKTGGQKALPDSPLPRNGPLPLAFDFGFPIQRADDAKGQTLSLVRFGDGGTVDADPLTPTKYKGLFLKVLMVVAEHFEQITHADQYEGRIEARSVDTKRTGIIREASVSLQASGDGGLLITVLVNKVKTSGDKSEVIGRDSDLEQVILDMRTAQEMQNETQKRPARRAGEGMATPPSQQGEKETPPTTTPPSQWMAGMTLPSPGYMKHEPQYEPAGASALKGAWRVESVKGGEGAYDAFRKTDLIFVGERLVAAPSGSDDFSPAGVYQVHLGAKRPAREIDLTQKGEAGGTPFLGIYDVKGDELLLCLSAQQGTRPTTLEAGRKQALLVARRVKE